MAICAENRAANFRPALLNDELPGFFIVFAAADSLEVPKARDVGSLDLRWRLRRGANGMNGQRLAAGAVLAVEHAVFQCRFQHRGVGVEAENQHAVFELTAG